MSQHGSKAPFRARIGHVRYCSHRYRIAALRQYMARPAKPIKLTTRKGPGDDNASTGHDGTTRSCHSSLKSSGTSPNFFSTTASENSPTFGSPARLNATARALAGSLDIPSARLIAAASLWHSCRTIWLWRSGSQTSPLQMTQRSVGCLGFAPILARPGEITQLRGGNVIEPDGVHALRITPDAGDVKGYKARVVPLYEHLIAQGFLRFVAQQGTGPLFYRTANQQDDTDPWKAKNHATFRQDSGSHLGFAAWASPTKNSHRTTLGGILLSRLLTALVSPNECLTISPGTLISPSEPLTARRSSTIWRKL
jgi:hypothetical protein